MKQRQHQPNDNRRKYFPGCRSPSSPYIERHHEHGQTSHKHEQRGGRREKSRRSFAAALSPPACHSLTASKRQRQHSRAILPNSRTKQLLIAHQAYHAVRFLAGQDVQGVFQLSRNGASDWFSSFLVHPLQSCRCIVSARARRRLQQPRISKNKATERVRSRLMYGVLALTCTLFSVHYNKYSPILFLILIFPEYVTLPQKPIILSRISIF